MNNDASPTSFEQAPMRIILTPCKIFLVKEGTCNGIFQHLTVPFIICMPAQIVIRTCMFLFAVVNSRHMILYVLVACGILTRLQK